MRATECGSQQHLVSPTNGIQVSSAESHIRLLIERSTYQGKLTPRAWNQFTEDRRVSAGHWEGTLIRSGWALADSSFGDSGGQPATGPASAWAPAGAPRAAARTA